MNVIEKNEGTKIPYEIDGTKICFNDDLTINLAKRQADDPVTVVVCSDKSGNLVIGTKSGLYYVAEIEIPATVYEEVETGETTTTASTDEDGNETTTETAVTTLEAQDLDMDDVTLTLWALVNYTV